ncbi:xenobiotic ABC transporter ATP-binding protein [Marivirga tractuosa]|uniref:ABC transporter related protein n=1 Tax=Marivirga tractuosa (strain ATCC 23168 / DSM 4126 / NBRC 15989 / NCIMB 1408 / VKM B-1430 / H-43) TaxID=643867 RepID=E4TV15_MARTH|nr:ABC transporter ATP-binding protein [Marivirga tractuosa]ADR22108.1 ABC transporter related protein [Marivirga tractuosa DSM 4126]BDD13430.1 xenobiotic ABC transporter ATP-binding protein [Marivirga tractuosa]
MKKDDIKSGNIIDTSVLRRLYKFVKPYQGRFYFLVFLTLALAVLAPARPFVIQKAIDNPIAQGDFQGLINMTLILVGLLVMQAIVQYGHTYLSGWLGQYIIRDIRIKLYRHLLNLRLKFFDKTPIGRLVTRNVSDVETLSDVFSQGLAAMIGDILQILFILGMMFAMSWKLTLVSLATLPLLFLSTYIFKEKVKVAFNQVRNAVSNLNSFVQEHVTGMSIVQIFTAEKREYEEFKKINMEHKKANIRSVLYYSIYFPVAEVIQATGIGLLVWYGAKGVVNEVETGITLGMLIAFILYIQMFFRPIRLIADRFNTLQMGIVSSSRILNLLDNKENIPNSGDYAPEKVKGDISFKNVEFAYNEEDVVLKNISFDVKEGQSVALVGATGAGKSSIINLLSRFYDIQKGEITLDGKDLKDYDLYALRQNIGVVLQDVFLFSDTILYNITLGNPDISLKEVKAAAELVGARKFIERLPGGYDYNVMERGATLSVGQRQLISFVRAMVYNPKIIVLDEATSSVDTETEEMIQNAIEKMMKGRTSIVIAHRLSTIQEADKIIVLDKGEIKETGTHQELLEKGGFYHQLHNMQYKEMS